MFIYRFFTLLLVLFFLAIRVELAAQAVPSDSIRVLTWNVQLLPRSFALFSSSLRKKQGKRIEPIARFCIESNCDIILLQEVFGRSLSRRLRRRLRQAYPYQYKPRSKGLKISNGLLIVSKTPIRPVADIFYEDKTDIDRMASKGAVLVAIESKGQLMQVANTHLQAGNVEANAQARKKQIQALAKLVDEYRDEAALQVLGGDLNTSKTNGEAYEFMMRNFSGFADGDIDDVRPFTSDPHNTWVERDLDGPASQLDYILFRGARLPDVKLRLHRPQFLYKGQLIDCADHYPVEAVWLPK